METLLHGLPFYIILSVVVQGIWGSPPSRGTTLRKEGLEAKFEFCLFSKVERIYLGVCVRVGASISVAVGGCENGRYLFELALEFEKEGGLVGLEIGAAVVVMAGRDEGRFVYPASNVDRGVYTGDRRGGGG